MARIPPRLIDCTQAPDLLEGLPVAALVRKSPTACALADELSDSWTLSTADLDGAGCRIDAGAGHIVLDDAGLSAAAIMRSRYFQNTLALRAFAALRAAWQAERIDDARNMHRPDLWPLIGRVLAADIAALGVRMAFEAGAEGEDTLWRHALGDEIGDMAAGYARVLERRLCDADDAQALRGAFTQWFSRESRVRACDHATLSDMDARLNTLTMGGRGQIGEGAIRCLTIDPLAGTSYLGPVAGEIAGNPAWRDIADPVAEAHFAQVISEIGTTRMGAVAVRDKKLAARLFPDALITA